ncbi:hypothetical protein ACFLQL_00225 [Verrucomicrobiota bacterium]
MADRQFTDDTELTNDLLQQILDKLEEGNPLTYSAFGGRSQFPGMNFGSAEFGGYSKPERAQEGTDAITRGADSNTEKIIRQLRQPADNAGQAVFLATMEKIFPQLGNFASTGNLPDDIGLNKILSGSYDDKYTRGLSANEFLDMQQQMIAGRYKQGLTNMGTLLPGLDQPTRRQDEIDRRLNMSSQLAGIIEPFKGATGIKNTGVAMAYVNQLGMAGAGGLRRGDWGLAGERMDAITGMGFASSRNSQSIVEGMLQTQAILQPAMGPRDIFTNEYDTRNLFGHLMGVEQGVTAVGKAQDRTGDLRWESGVRRSLAGLRAAGMQSTVGRRAQYQAANILGRGGSTAEIERLLQSGATPDVIAAQLGGRYYDEMTPEQMVYLQNIYPEQMTKIAELMGPAQRAEHTGNIVQRSRETMRGHLRDIGASTNTRVGLTTAEDTKLRYEAVLPTLTGITKKAATETWARTGSITEVMKAITTVGTSDDAMRAKEAAESAVDTRFLEQAGAVVNDRAKLEEAVYANMMGSAVVPGAYAAAGEGTRAIVAKKANQIERAYEIEANKPAAYKELRKIDDNFKARKEANAKLFDEAAELEKKGAAAGSGAERDAYADAAAALKGQAVSQISVAGLPAATTLAGSIFSGAFKKGADPINQTEDYWKNLEGMVTDNRNLLTDDAASGMLQGIKNRSMDDVTKSFRKQQELGRYAADPWANAIGLQNNAELIKNGVVLSEEQQKVRKKIKDDALEQQSGAVAGAIGLDKESTAAINKIFDGFLISFGSYITSFESGVGDLQVKIAEAAEKFKPDEESEQTKSENEAKKEKTQDVHITNWKDIFPWVSDDDTLS